MAIASPDVLPGQPTDNLDLYRSLETTFGVLRDEYGIENFAGFFASQLVGVHEVNPALSTHLAGCNRLYRQRLKQHGKSPFPEIARGVGGLVGSDPHEDINRILVGVLGFINHHRIPALDGQDAEPGKKLLGAVSTEDYTMFSPVFKNVRGGLSQEQKIANIQRTLGEPTPHHDSIENVTSAATRYGLKVMSAAVLLAASREGIDLA